jgi:hypothetical protein
VTGESLLEFNKMKTLENHGKNTDFLSERPTLISLVFRSRETMLKETKLLERFI